MVKCQVSSFYGHSVGTGQNQIFGVRKDSLFRIVIEAGFRDPFYCEQGGLIRPFPGTVLKLLERHGRQIGDGNNSGAGVAVDSREGIKLLHVDIFYTGFFIDAPHCRLIRRLVHLQETTGDGPLTIKGIDIPFDQEQAELFVPYGENQYVDSH